MLHVIACIATEHDYRLVLLAALICAVTSFTAFHAYLEERKSEWKAIVAFSGEHDFGDFEIEGERYFWKIDYYAPDLDGGSEDPADPAQTARVLTIMCVDEY